MGLYRRGIGMVLVALVLGSACGSDEPSTGTDDEGQSIVVTTTIWGDLVNGLARDDAAVEVLIQPGQDPHAFAPSARQVETLLTADLVVANGFDLEEGLVDLLDSAASEGVHVLEMAPLMDPLVHQAEGEEHADEEHTEGDHGDDGHSDDGHTDDEGDHEHGPEDPHVWHDPVRMADAAMILATEIAEIDETLDDATWTERGEALSNEILSAHADVEAILAQVPEACRKLVTNHDSLSYFANRYGFGIVGTVIPGTSSSAEASAADFAALANTVGESGVSAVFGATTESTRLAEALAAEVGEDVVVASLHTESLGEPGSGAETYTGLLTTNAQLIADALADCPAA